VGINLNNSLLKKENVNGFGTLVAKLSISEIVY
jgi:hypothetical protein